MSNLQWSKDTPFAVAAVRHGFEISLGKMRQSEPDSHTDELVPYLKSISIQWNGVHTDDSITMWASPSERRDLEALAGDLFVCEGGDIGRAAIYDGPAGFIFEKSVHRARPRQGNDIRFFKYVLEAVHGTGWLDVLTGKATIGHLTREKLQALEIPYPDIEAQRSIADYLDAETARIDRLIDAQRNMVSLIEERRNALTSALVFGKGTAGEIQDSTLATVGDVPADWSIVRNKSILREVAELSTTGEEELLTVSHLTGVTPRSEKDVNMFLAESTVGYKICKPGDLIINTLWAWMGALGVTPYSGIVSPAYGVYRLIDTSVYGPYLDALLRTPEYVTEMTRYSKGVWTSRLRLYPESFLALSVPLPPLKEQVRIVESITHETEREARLTMKLEAFARRLSERRLALITAAVTGQSDINTIRSADVLGGN